MANFVGNLTSFDHRSHDWEVFYGKLVQFIKLNQIGHNQSAVLLTHLSDESYRLAANLLYPKKIEEVDFNEVVQVLKSHLSPKRSSFADRALFYQATQSEGESLEDWAARIRGLAISCDFGSELQLMLRDRFVLGLEIGPERDRLFEQDLNTLTFSHALTLAQKVGSSRRCKVVRVNETAFKREGEPGRLLCSICGLNNDREVRVDCKNVCHRCGCHQDTQNCAEVDSQQNAECVHNLRLPSLTVKQLPRLLQLVIYLIIFCFVNTLFLNGNTSISL